MKRIAVLSLALAGFGLLAIGLTGCTSSSSTPAPAKKEMAKPAAPVAKPMPAAPATK